MPQELQTIYQAKQLQLHGKSHQLILKDEPTEDSVSITAILISQYISALTEEGLLNTSYELLNPKHKLSHPIVFALVQRCLSKKQIMPALKLLSSHIDRKKQSKTHILIYNVAKLYQQTCHQNKQIFYLETLLKEEPFFVPAAYDLAMLLVEKQPALATKLLGRHLNTCNSKDPFIHSAAIYCASFGGSHPEELIRCLNNCPLTLTNAYNLALLFRKKKDFSRGETILLALIAHCQTIEGAAAKHERNRKLLLLTRLNLLKIYLQIKQEKVVELVSIISEQHKEELDIQTQAQLNSLTSNELKKQVSSQNHKENQPPGLSPPGSRISADLNFLSTFNQNKKQNQAKLKTLILKEKQIDHFFKNLNIKVRSPEKVRLLLAKSVAFAKQELSSVDYDKQAENPTVKPSPQASKELNSSQFETMLRKIMFNLQLMKADYSKQLKSSDHEPSQTQFNFSSKPCHKKVQVAPLRLTAKVQKEQGPTSLISERTSSHFRIKPLSSFANQREPRIPQKKTAVTQAKPVSLNKKSQIAPKNNTYIFPKKDIDVSLKSTNKTCLILSQPTKIEQQKIIPSEEREIFSEKKKQEIAPLQKVENKMQMPLFCLFETQQLDNKLEASNKKVALVASEQEQSSTLSQAEQSGKQLQQLQQLQQPKQLQQFSQPEPIQQPQELSPPMPTPEPQQPCLQQAPQKQQQLQQSQQIQKPNRLQTIQQKPVEMQKPSQPELSYEPQKNQPSSEQQRPQEPLKLQEPLQLQTQQIEKQSQFDKVNDSNETFPFFAIVDNSKGPLTPKQQPEEDAAEDPVQKSQQLPIKVENIFEQKEEDIASNQLISFVVLKDEATALVSQKHCSKLQITESNEEIVNQQKSYKPEPLHEEHLSQQKFNPQTNQNAARLTPKEKSNKQLQFDPLNSTFNLTGFVKPVFKKQSAPENLNSSPLPFDFFKALSPTAPKAPEILDETFQRKMKEVDALETAGKIEGAYNKLLELYKQYKGANEKSRILLKIGKIFERQDKWLEAEKTYIRCTSYNSAESFLYLGSLQLQMAKIQEGVENLEKANCIRRFDINIENQLVYGYSLRQETMQKALTLAHSILRKEPNSLQTLLITAGILQRQGLLDEAIQIVTAMDDARKAEYIKHYLGILYLEASNIKQAFGCFKAALVIKPDYVPSLIEVASIVSETHPKEAISILNKVIQLNPTNRKALARLGKIYEAQNDFQNAMKTYKVALESQENYESYMKIGDCLAKKQSYIQALLNYKQALNMKKTPEAYAQIGRMFELNNEYTKAVENYQSALNLMSEGPHDIATYRSHLKAIGRLQLKLCQFEAAIASLDDVHQGQQSVEICKLLGEAYFGNKQYPQSLEYLEKANVLSNGTDLDILESMAMCLDRMEEYLASKAIYEKVLQKNPNNIRCLNNLANILLITGETNEAFYLFESLLEKAPKSLEKRLKIADIYAQVGDWSKVQYHLLQCYRQKQHDSRILQKLILLYKEKRDTKMAAKYEKKLSLLKVNHKKAF